MQPHPHSSNTLSNVKTGVSDTYYNVSDGIRYLKSGQATSQAKQTANTFLQNYLTEDGVTKVKSKFSSVFDDFSLASFGVGAFAEIAGTAFGMSMRLNEGEAFLPALGAELVDNVKYGIAPELLVAEIGAAAISAYPQMNAMAEQKKYFGMNYNYLGGNYIDTQANFASRSRAMEHIKRTRSTIAASIGGEARRFHST